VRPLGVRPARSGAGSDRDGAPRRPWRRVAAVAGVLLASVGALAMAGARPAAAATAAGSARTPLVQALCPDTFSVYPPLDSPAQSSSYYGVALATRISGGVLRLGRSTITTGLDATVCGLLRFPQLTATIPGQACTPATEPTGCISFGEASTAIDGLVDLPTTFSAGTTTVSVSHTAAADGGLVVTISTTVTTHVLIARFGVDCSVGPIAVSLTTSTSGPLSGSAVTGPLTDATARIVGASFAVPGATASTTCPSGLIPATDGLVGLPAPAGVGQFSAPLTLANSLQ